jgi:hypothetical protein
LAEPDELKNHLKKMKAIRKQTLLAAALGLMVYLVFAMTLYLLPRRAQ